MKKFYSDACPVKKSSAHSLLFGVHHGHINNKMRQQLKGGVHYGKEEKGKKESYTSQKSTQKGGKKKSAS